MDTETLALIADLTAFAKGIIGNGPNFLLQSARLAV